MGNTGRDILTVLFWLSATAVVYTYFLYPLLLWLLGKLCGGKNAQVGGAASAAEDLPSVTMIVSAYNEQAVLGAKIANCRAIDYPAQKLSFLFGSDGSDDGTGRILRGIGDGRFRVVHSRIRRGKVGMLNELMKLAGSEIVVFSDANTMYEAGAILELVKPFREARVGCVIGKLELTAASDDGRLCNTEGLYWRYENWIKKIESALGAVSTINGGIFAVRAGLYEELPVQAVTEDQVLGMKLMVRGYRCVFAAEARAQETVSTWAGELRRRVRISAGNFQSLFLVPGILHPRCGRVSFSFVSHKLLRWLAPLFLLTMLASNVVLVGRPFYGSTLLLQVLFYGSGVLGLAVGKVGGVLKVLAIPKYFLAMNLAVVMGLIRFLRGRQRVTWAKSAR